MFKEAVSTRAGSGVHPVLLAPHEDASRTGAFLFFFFFLKEEMKNQSMGCLGISPAPYVFPKALVCSPHSQCCTTARWGSGAGWRSRRGDSGHGHHTKLDNRHAG